MKTSLRLVTLLGVMYLVSWALSPRPAYAFPSCENLSGGPCSPDGRMINCTWTSSDPTFPGHCFCTDGLWECI